MNIIKSLSEVWSKYQRRRARVAELRAIDSADMRRLMQDTGLTFCELIKLAKTEGEASKLLHRRMETIGLDSSKIDVAVLRDMQRCCSECDNKELCAHELEDKPKMAAWPTYCPNQQTLEALTRMESK